MNSVLIVVVGLLNLTNVVVAMAEGRLPVLLVKVRVILNILRARAWCGESVLDAIRNLVVFVTSYVTGKTESLPPVTLDVLCLSNELAVHNLFYHRFLYKSIYY